MSVYINEKSIFVVFSQMAWFSNLALPKQWIFARRWLWNEITLLECVAQPAAPARLHVNRHKVKISVNWFAQPPSESLLRTDDGNPLTPHAHISFAIRVDVKHGDEGGSASWQQTQCGDHTAACWRDRQEYKSRSCVGSSDWATLKRCHFWHKNGSFETEYLLPSD